MQAWWMSMDLFSQTLWGLAVFSSLVFVGQMIMTFAGMDSDINADLDVCTDGDPTGSTDGPFQLFTFRNFINFLLGFSWTALAFRGPITNVYTLLALAVGVGILLVAAVMFIFKWMSQMEQSGNIDVKNAAGCIGEVYLPIPGQKQGEGKVQITISGAIREYDAITEGETLRTGTPIRVVKVLNERLLQVTNL